MTISERWCVRGGFGIACHCQCGVVRRVLPSDPLQRMAHSDAFAEERRIARRGA